MNDRSLMDIDGVDYGSPEHTLSPDDMEQRLVSWNLDQVLLDASSEDSCSTRKARSEYHYLSWHLYHYCNKEDKDCQPSHSTFSKEQIIRLTNPASMGQQTTSILVDAQEQGGLSFFKSGCISIWRMCVRCEHGSANNINIG